MTQKTPSLLIFICQRSAVCLCATGKVAGKTKIHTNTQMKKTSWVRKNPSVYSFDKINMIKKLPPSSQRFLVYQSSNDMLFREAISPGRAWLGDGAVQILPGAPFPCLPKWAIISIMVCAAAWRFLLINPRVTAISCSLLMDNDGHCWHYPIWRQVICQLQEWAINCVCNQLLHSICRVIKT